MGMRDWLIIIVIVGIVVILLDGYRRKRKDSIRVKLEKNIPDIDDSVLDKAELPNGGARIKSRNFQAIDSSSQNYGQSASADEDYEEAEVFDKYDDFDGSDEEEAENVPVLMDAVEIEGRKGSAEVDGGLGRGIEPVSVDIDDDEESIYENFEEADEELDEEADKQNNDDEESDDDNETELPEDLSRAERFDKQAKAYVNENDTPTQTNNSAQNKAHVRPEQESKGGRIEPTFGEMAAFSAEELEDKPSHLKTKKPPASSVTQQPKSKAEKDTKREKPSSNFVAQAELFSESPKDFIQEDAEYAEDEDENLEPEEVIVINVMAKQGDLFAGKELLPILLQQGMQLGKMSIFHKHRDSQGNGPTMFSMANMVKPGTFDASEMDEFTTPGVSFFLQLPNSLGNMRCFEQMLNAANAIKQTLNGDLKDENRSVITRQTIEHCKQRIQDFELAQLSKK